MRRSRWVIAAIAATAVCWSAASASAAHAAPTLVLTQNCSKLSTGELDYGLDISVTGLAPNAAFTGQLEWTYIDPPPGQVGGSIGPATFTADANGNFSISFGTIGIKARYTATVVYQGQTLTQTLTVTCEPATKDECKNGGWRGFFGVFESQGDCVGFVATGGKNEPSGP